MSDINYLDFDFLEYADAFSMKVYEHRFEFIDSYLKFATKSLEDLVKTYHFTLGGETEEEDIQKVKDIINESMKKANLTDEDGGVVDMYMYGDRDKAALLLYNAIFENTGTIGQLLHEVVDTYRNSPRFKSVKWLQNNCDVEDIYDYLMDLIEDAHECYREADINKEIYEHIPKNNRKFNEPQSRVISVVI